MNRFFLLSIGDKIMLNISSNYSQMSSLLKIMEVQKNELNNRQNEISSGRKSDLSLNLGAEIRRGMNVHSLLNSYNAYLKNNLIIQSRLQFTQTTLSDIFDNADKFKSSLMLAQNDARGQNIIEMQATNALGLFISSLNNSIDNKYIFGGEKTNIPPINGFFVQPISAAKSAIDAAFSSAPPDGFGFPQTSLLVSTITPQQLDNFINGSLAELFSANEWTVSWSNASVKSLKNMISPKQKIDTSITVNDPALRKIAMAYVIGSSLGAENMNARTYQTLARKAVEILDEGLKLLNSSRTRIGVMQQTLELSNSSLEKQTHILEMQINGMESIDQTEIATRTAGLLTRIEATMTLTSRISALSLARYI